MSYSIKLKSKKEIKETDIDSIMQSLPDKYNFPANDQGIKTSKQNWGWSAVCDVIISKNIVSVNGSYSISGNIAEEFANYLKAKLKDKGYKISIDKSDF